MFSTLPTLKTLVPSIKSVLSYSRKGKMSVWLKALSGRKAGQPWGAYDFMILAFFCMWWPGEQNRFDILSRDLTDLFLVTLSSLRPLHPHDQAPKEGLRQGRKANRKCSQASPMKIDHLIILLRNEDTKAESRMLSMSIQVDGVCRMGKMIIGISCPYTASTIDFAQTLRPPRPSS